MITGILLAAGAGTRFGGGKLLEVIPSLGLPMCLAAARTLREGVDRVVAITRPRDADLFALLAEEPGMEVFVGARALEGMGGSLVCGVTASLNSTGWLVALGDMPFIRPATITRLAEELRQGAPLVAPTFGGQRGHPVGIHRQFCDELLQLRGDVGAREIIGRHKDLLRLIETDDPGVLQDVDTREALSKLA